MNCSLRSMTNWVKGGWGRPNKKRKDKGEKVQWNGQRKNEEINNESRRFLVHEKRNEIFKEMFPIATFTVLAVVFVLCAVDKRFIWFFWSPPLEGESGSKVKSKTCRRFVEQRSKRFFFLLAASTKPGASYGERRRNQIHQNIVFFCLIESSVSVSFEFQEAPPKRRYKEASFMPCFQPFLVCVLSFSAFSSLCFFVP